MDLCHNCQAPLDQEEAHPHHGRLLCDDCYMDALSPPRTCDPWAVRSAKLAEASGEVSEATPLQQRILDLLARHDGLTLAELASRLNLRPADLERQLAGLRHLEKIRAARRASGKVFVLW